MKLPYSTELNIESLGRLFDNTSECYKLFWFKAIVERVSKGETELPYETLVNDMIVNAWYMVTEYKLNLGPKDNLEDVVKLIKKKYPELKPSERKDRLFNFISCIDDKEIISKKRTLTYNVPYRLQAPFIKNIRGKEWNVGESKLIDTINKEKRLIYYFSELNGLSTRIHIQDEWVSYIIDNQEIIRGWLEFNLICYLQRRNPSVPGIADKIIPPQERDLSKVNKLWKSIFEVSRITDIYADIELNDKKISIDHFIPWSYVAHDELWNLTPTTKSINSSKSNNLPDWDMYFKKFVVQQQKVYSLIWKYERIHKQYEECVKYNLSDEYVRERLYKPGIQLETFANELEAIIHPVFQSAKNCGFEEWSLKA